MTLPHEFLAQKRLQRTRGKLAGLIPQILELRKLGGTYGEIAEYLQLKHGITVTRSGIQKHLKSLDAKLSRQVAAAHIQNASSDVSLLPTAVSLPLQSVLPGNAQATERVVTEPTATHEENIRAIDETRPDGLLTRYDRNSPEHLAKVAALRSQRTQSKP